MSHLRIEWDLAKNTLNKLKHRISFEEASSVFLDEHGLIMSDPEHSHDEERFVLIGLNDLLKLLVVCHCYRDNENVIRIISARKADKKEQAVYAARRRP